MIRRSRSVKVAVSYLCVAVLGGIICMWLTARKIPVLGEIEECAHVRVSLQDGRVLVYAVEPHGGLLVLDLKTKESKKSRIKDLEPDGTQHISLGGLFAPMTSAHYGVRGVGSNIVNLFLVRRAGGDCHTRIVDLDSGVTLLRLEGDWYFLPAGDAIYLVWPSERLPGKNKQEYIFYRYVNDTLQKLCSWQPDLPVQNILLARSQGNSIRIVCEGLLRKNQGSQDEAEQLGQARAIYVIELETQTARILRCREVLQLRHNREIEEYWPSAAAFQAPSPDNVCVYDPQSYSVYFFDWKTLQRTRELKVRIPKRSKDNEWEFVPFFIAHANKPLALVIFPMGFVYLLDLSDGSLRLLGDEHFKKLDQLVRTRSKEEPLVGLAALHFVLTDGIFMPNDNQVAVVAGSGHVYIYDLGQSKLSTTFRLTTQDIFEPK